MPAKKLYSYYESGSTAKKYGDYNKVAPRKNVKTGKNKLNRKSQVKAKNNISAILFVISIFSLTMVITYRFNLISEKNLEVQQLKNELVKVESTLATSQIDVEQGTDLNKIEAYAKQQLGMQKPDKNQTIYVDTSVNENATMFEGEITALENIVNGIKDFVNKIF